MRTTPLGPGGPEVSALCLGTMRFGTAHDEDTSRAILDRYGEAGGRFLDTANVYSVWEPNGEGGDSERLLARWMKDRGNRAEMFVATKVGSRKQESGRGLRPEQIRHEFARCLDNLQTDRVDLLYAHFDDPGEVPVGEYMAAFNELVDAGQLAHLGASNYHAWRLEAVRHACAERGIEDYCCLQLRHSYLQPDPWRGFGVQVCPTPELLDYCRRRKMTMLPFSPLLGGCYARDDKDPEPQYDSPRNAARLAALRTMAAEKGCTANQLVLAWMLHHECPTIPIIAASGVAQLDENLGALDITLSGEELRVLDEAG